MTKFRKLVAAAVAALAIGTIGTGAYASTYALPQYENYFKFKFTGYGGTQYSSLAEKTNSTENDAKVQATGGYVSDTNQILVNVSYYKLNTNTRVRATEEEAITSPVDNLSLKYNIERGQGSANLLVGVGNYYASEVEGTWEP